MTLLLDRRVGSIELHPHLLTPHSVCDLDYGDAVVVGHTTLPGESDPRDVMVGIERKRIRDLISSMESGRLVAHQLPGMGEEYDRSYLVIEGLWQTNKKGELEIWQGKGFRPLRYGKRVYGSKEVHSFLISVRELFGVPTLFTPNLLNTASWIDHIHRWYNKKKHRTAETMMVNPVPAAPGFKRPKTLARMLVGMDGIGGRKALDIAHHFGSMMELMAASVTDIMEVEGVGQTIAEGIYRQLRTRG